VDGTRRVKRSSLNFRINAKAVGYFLAKADSSEMTKVYKMDTAEFDLAQMLDKVPKDILLSEEKDDRSADEILNEEKCDKCNFNSSKKSALMVHKQLVHDPNFYKCDKCDTRTKTEEALLYHKERKHKVDQEKLKCDLCDKAFVKLHGLIVHYGRMHKSNHSKTSIRCDLCDQPFVAKHILWLHKEIAHICKPCNIKGIKNMKEHIKNDHDQPKPTLKRRISQVKDSDSKDSPPKKKNKCDKCEESYESEFALNLHMEEKHEEMIIDEPKDDKKDEKHEEMAIDEPKNDKKQEEETIKDLIEKCMLLQAENKRLKTCPKCNYNNKPQKEALHGDLNPEIIVQTFDQEEPWEQVKPKAKTKKTNLTSGKTEGVWGRHRDKAPDNLKKYNFRFSHLHRCEDCDEVFKGIGLLMKHMKNQHECNGNIQNIQTGPPAPMNAEGLEAQSNQGIQTASQPMRPEGLAPMAEVNDESMEIDTEEKDPRSDEPKDPKLGGGQGKKEDPRSDEPKVPKLGGGQEKKKDPRSDEPKDPKLGGGQGKKEDRSPDEPRAPKSGGGLGEKVSKSKGSSEPNLGGGGEQINEDKEWNCEKCDYQASTEDFLRKHMNEKHNESLNTLICNFCKARFSSKREMARHRKDTHFTYKVCMNMADCEFQEECFYSHVPIPEGKHRCFQCGVDFESKREMMGHRKKEHEDIKVCKDKQCKRGQNCWWRHEPQAKEQNRAKGKGGEDFYITPENTAPTITKQQNVIQNRNMQMMMTKMEENLKQMMNIMNLMME
jgi:hypothetical protein